MWGGGVTYLSDLLKMAEANHTGVAADDVQATEEGNNIIHQLGDLSHVPHVSLHRDGLGTEGLDLGDNLLSRLARVGVVDNNRRTVAAQLNSHRSADATAGASDEGDLAVQAVGEVGSVGAHCAGLGYGLLKD